MEIWKPIIGFEGCYEVSDAGRVRSLDRMVKHHTGSLKRWRGRILRQTASHGYLRVSLSGNGKTAQPLVHAIVATAFLGERPIGFQVCHSDGNPKNNVVTNLRYGSPKDNARDRSSHGREWRGGAHEPTRGEAVHTARLTEDDVRRIRSTPLTYGAHRRLAKEYGVARATISSILANRSWKHVS